MSKTSSTKAPSKVSGKAVELAGRDNAKELHWKEMSTKMVTVGNVHIVDRIIHPTKARIDAMAKSLAGPLGQLQPILVHKYLHSALKVVAGATRLLAAKQLGWNDIKATIISADNEIEYQLIEIAENLHRHDLGDTERGKLKKLERALFDQRHALFEKELEEHPEITAVKAKGGRGKKGGVRDAARKVGVHPATAHKRVRKLSTNAKVDSLPEPDAPDLSPPDTAPEHIIHQPEPVRHIETVDRGEDAPAIKPCPLCHGTGHVEI